MKISKGVLPDIFLILYLGVILVGCGEDDYSVPKEFCGDQTIEGSVIENEIGRIYYYNFPDSPKFYYIGSPDTTGGYVPNGGHVPCNSLSEAYLPNGKVGSLVRFSGQTKYNLQDEIDPSDPLYTGIDLTFIEKLEEESQ